MMPMTDLAHIALSEREEPVLLAWPTQGNAGGFIRFEKAADWRAFVQSLSIDARIPEIVRAKFARAQTLYLLGWVDFSVVKAGEGCVLGRGVGDGGGVARSEAVGRAQRNAA